QKEQILALKQKFGWGPEAIAKALKLPEEDVRRFLEGDGDDDKDDTGGKLDSDEWWTPPHIVELVRDVLGGIELDPASCDGAQKTVQAEEYFKKREDGLKQEWRGKVLLQPLYSNPAPWVNKLIDDYESGAVTAAIALVNNQTDAVWFQRALEHCSAFCIWKGRITFRHRDKSKASGQLAVIPMSWLVGSRASSRIRSYTNVS